MRFSHEGERFHQNILLVFKLVTQIHHIDQEKAACFKSEFRVSCASYITTLLTTNTGDFLPVKLRKTAHSCWKLRQSATISSSCHEGQQESEVCASASAQSRREITLIWGETNKMSTVCCFGRAGALVYVVRPKSLAASSANLNCVTSHHCCGRIF